MGAGCWNKLAVDLVILIGLVGVGIRFILFVGRLLPVDKVCCKFGAVGMVFVFWLLAALCKFGAVDMDFVFWLPGA
jgi:hypothetical protein